MIFLYKKIIIFTLIILNLSLIASVHFINQNDATKEVLSRYGSSGSEVKEIQTRLKRWGYYNGTIDGIYGTKTVNAVKYFQRKNGLSVDGIAHVPHTPRPHTHKPYSDISVSKPSVNLSSSNPLLQTIVTLNTKDSETSILTGLC